MAIYCLEKNIKIPGRPLEPVVFRLSEKNLLPEEQAFKFDSFHNHHLYAHCELVIQVSRPGRNIKADEAHKYFDRITTGISFTALDIQSVLNGLEISWEEAKDWQYSVIATGFTEVADLGDLSDVHFCVYKNRMPEQMGHSKNMILSLEEVVARVSLDFALENGDLIFTGAPSSFFEVDEEDVLEVFLEDDSICEIMISGNG